MAKLSAHGMEIGRHESLTCRYAYMSDGAILRDTGSGWKKWGKVREGITPADALARMLDARKVAAAKWPAHDAYRREIESYSIKTRWKVHAAVELAPQDPDGVWADLTDDYGEHGAYTLEEVLDLCRLYRAAESDRKAMHAETLARRAARQEQVKVEG